MKIVQPDDITTLMTNRNYEGIAFITARAALRHLMTGRVKGMDASGMTYSWDGADINIAPTGEMSSLNWYSRNLQYFDDQPALRSSAGNTGGTVEWAIPTVVVCTNHFGYRPRGNEKVNLRKLYKFYKGVCQLCLKHGPISDMTIDHVYPRSLGGTNHDFNLVLAHRNCNHMKGAQTPFLNAAGKEVRGRPMLQCGIFVPTDNVRDEWYPYLYKEKQ